VKGKCTNKNTKQSCCEPGIETLSERFKKLRALNCTDPHDVGLDGYTWKKFQVTTKAHLVARMF
jgi:hypothetical protein